MPWAQVAFLWCVIKAFSGTIRPYFFVAFYAISDQRIICPETSTHIEISKEGKDSTQCASYKPISLLNQDFKLLMKIFAMRLIFFYFFFAK